MPCLQATALESPQSQNVSTLVDKLLTADFSLSRPIRISVQKVLSLADDFTLPFCLLKLSSMLSTAESNSANSEGGVSSHVQAFDRAIEMAVATGNTTWTCIVPLLDISIAQHLRSRAETQFLSLFPSPKTTDGIINMPERVKQAENLLYIIEATAYSILMPPPNSTLSSEMVTTFNNTWQLISIVNIHNTELKEVMLHKWLPLLLSFATIHSSAFELNKAGNESRARTLLALAAIILELQALEPMAPVISAMIERAFDLGLQLVDLLPDDMRQQCIRGLRDTTSDPRIAYLFSIAPNPSGWLVLSQKEKAMGANGQVEEKEKLAQFPLKRWEMLGDPTPVIGVNDTSISLTLFGAGRG
jgi:mediator of RNA polymerase II transcription subunit 12